MKSSKEDLRKRGYIEEADILDFQHLSDEELINLVDSRLAHLRTIAIRLLNGRNFIANQQFVELILEKLTREKCLYTKLEICSFLEQGDIKVVRLMINYLGCIGKNQYKELPNKVSKKKSYPLPRDIIARSLARMSISIMPALIEALNCNSINKISEAIDAIGFMLFYNRAQIKDEHFKAISHTMIKYSEYDLIYWKFVICLSAFKTKESIDILNEILISDKHEQIKREAKRSLQLNLIS